MDLLVTGVDDTNDGVTKLYENDGTGSFTLIEGTPFDHLDFSAIAIADVDQDDDQDVLITGSKGAGHRIARLYLNAGNGAYTVAVDTPFDGVYWGSTTFADIDGDQDQDVLITGQGAADEPTAKVYINDGRGSFTLASDPPFDSVYSSSVACADVDGDEDEDILVTGRNPQDERIAKLYINNSLISSTSRLASLSKLNLSVYPNPVVEDQLRLSFKSNEMGKLSIKIYDTSGRLLQYFQRQASIGQQMITIDVSSLSKGSYHVEISHGVQVGVQKFIVP